MPARNHFVSYSQANETMWRDSNPGTYSIKGEYSGIKIGVSWTYIIHRMDLKQNRLLKQSEYPTEHVLTHIKVGNSMFEIGD